MDTLNSNDRILQLLQEYATLAEEQAEQLDRLLALAKKWRELYEQATT